VIATDTLGTATVTFDGDEHHGFAALNRIVNPRLGTDDPPAYLGGTTNEGLTHLEDR